MFQIPGTVKKPAGLSAGACHPACWEVHLKLSVHADFRPLSIQAIAKADPQVSQKVLTQQLRERCDHRPSAMVYPEKPPGSTTVYQEDGLRLIPILNELYQWGSTIRSLIPKVERLHGIIRFYSWGTFAT